MSRKRKAPTSPQPQLPFGTETPRPRGVLALWIVLFVGWFLFMLALALRNSLEP